MHQDEENVACLAGPRQIQGTWSVKIKTIQCSKIFQPHSKFKDDKCLCLNANVMVFAYAYLKVKMRRDKDGEHGQIVTLSNGIFYSAFKKNGFLRPGISQFSMYFP